MVATVAEARGVDRRATAQVAVVHGIATVPERIPGRRGRAAQTVSRAEADYLFAVHNAVAE